MNDKNLRPEKELTGLLEHEAEKIDSNLDLWPAIERQLKLAQTATQPAPESDLPLLDPDAMSTATKPVFTLPRVVKFALGIAAALAIAFIVGVAFLPGDNNSSIIEGSFIGPTATASNPTVPAATPTPRIVSGTLKATLTGHLGAVRALTWKSDGKQLASGSDAGELKTWDVTALKETASFNDGPPAGWPYVVGWTADNKILRVTMSNSQYQSPDGKLNITRKGPDAFKLEIDEDLAGETIAPLTTVTSGAPVKYYKIATISVPGGTIGQLAVSPDGKTVVGEGFAPHGTGPAGPGDVRVWFWRIDGTLITAIQDIFFPINSLAWSPDGKTVAIAAKGNYLAGLYSSEGKLIKFISDNYVVWQLTWSPDGQTLAAACSDNMVRLFGKTGNLMATLAGHQDSVEALAWSPDGKTLASGSGDKTIKLWTIK